MTCRNLCVLLLGLITIGVVHGSPIKAEGVTKPPVPPRGPQPVYGLAPGEAYELRDDLGQYAHGFVEADSGTQFAEQGELLSTNEGWEYVIVKRGSYSYLSPEGDKITVNYVADHNGFRVVP